MSKNVLILGGSGFIGRNIIEMFLDRTDYHVITIDKVPYAQKTINDNITIFTCDITKFDMKCVIEKYLPDIIINSAAIVGVDNLIKYEDNSSDILLNNSIITDNLLSAIKHIKSDYKPVVFFFSSSELYGYIVDEQNTTVCIDKNVCSSRLMYRKSKLADEQKYIEAKRDGLINAVVMRLFNIAGRYQNTYFVIPKLIKSCIVRESAVINVRNSYRSFCSVHYLTNTILNIIERNVYHDIPDIVNFGTHNKSNFTSIYKLALIILQELENSTVEKIEINKWNQDVEVFSRRPFYNKQCSLPDCVLAHDYDTDIKSIIDDCKNHIKDSIKI